MSKSKRQVVTDTALDAFVKGVLQRDGALGKLLSRSDSLQGVEHTPREIAQQPFLWRHTAHMMRNHVPALQAFLERAGMFEPECRPHLILTGAGTSDYVGSSLSDLLRTHFDTAVCSWPTTRITAAPDVFLSKKQRYLMLHFARSGNSPESTAVLRLGLEHFTENIRHVVITCNQEGALAALAREHPEEVYLIVLHEACNDRGLAMTSSFSAMVVAGQALAYLDDLDRFIDRTERVAAAGEYLMTTYSNALFDLADPQLNRVFYLGNADLLGAAIESALKVQELTVGQIMAKGEDTLAFRHGPISAVDAHTLLCFFLSADAYTRRYEVDVLLQYQEAFRRLGARIAIVTDRDAADGLDEGILRIAYDPEGRWRIPRFFQVNLAVLFGQLFGMFSSYRRGLNVDDPSVDKALYSRIVQGVRLYDYSDGM